MTHDQRTILVADSDRRNVEALATRLRDMGLRVQTAFDGVTALTSFAFVAPDVICIDSDLSDRRGPVCDTIVDDTLRSSVPVITLHNEDSEQLSKDCDTRVHMIAKTEALCDDVERLVNQLLV